MSAPTTPRAAVARDWPALLQAVREADAAVSPQARALWLRGQGPDPAPGWGPDYLRACQDALEQRKPERLLAMLDAQLPVPPLLLPVVAEVIRDARQGRSNGRASKLTHAEDLLIREIFDRMTTVPHYINRTGEFRPMKPAEAVAEMHAAHFTRKADGTESISIDTLKRSLKRTGPKP
jgi:hypothetical protein